MNKADQYYKDNLNKIINSGSKDNDPRAKWKDGTPAYSYFITQVFEEYDISKKEFPIPTIRNTAVKTGIKEILWIYQRQSSSLNEARSMGVNWWNEWDIGDDTIGQRYGATIKKWDLINKLLSSLKNDMFSRRHIITMYQQSDLESSKGLFPCAYETLWSVRKHNNILFLDLTLIQRSNDYIMAGYINKIQYVALQMMIAGHLGYEVGKFCHLVQNLHVYDRHLNAAYELLNKPCLNINPSISLLNKKDFYEYSVDDFIVNDIKNIPKLSYKLEIAV